MQVTPDHSADQKSVQQPQQTIAQKYEPETALSATLKQLVEYFELGFVITFILKELWHYIRRFQIVGWLVFGVCLVLGPIYLVLQACRWYSAKTQKKNNGSNHNGGLPRQQPGAKTIGHSLKRKAKPERVVDLYCPPWLW